MAFIMLNVVTQLLQMVSALCLWSIVWGVYLCSLQTMVSEGVIADLLNRHCSEIMTRFCYYIKGYWNMQTDGRTDITT